MSVRTRRKAFAAVDLIAVTVVVVLLLGLLLPAVSGSEGNQRRDQCADKLHMLGIALQNHHDAYKKFPVLSTEPYPQRVGSTVTPVTGFSWLVRILPFIEEAQLYTGISSTANKFVPGNAAFSNAVVDANGRHFATIQLDALICPDYPGDPISKLSNQAPYKSVPGQNPTAVPPIGIGISTYTALPATDIAIMKAVTPNQSDANGVIVPNKGINLRAITDGTSKTLVVCESLEESLNSWLDGGVNWRAGANPNNPAPPKLDAKKFLVMAKGDTTSLNVGPGSPDPGTRYLTKAKSPNGYEWAWGPSSRHAGGVVMHVYADAGVRPISESIEPTVYIQLITRAGGEPVVDPSVGN